MSKDKRGEIPNLYKCEKALWKKMFKRQRELYNELRSYNQSVISSAKYPLSDECWQVISHNFSYLAAIAVGESNDI